MIKMEKLKDDIKEHVHKCSFLRERIRCIQEEKLKVDKMLASCKDNKESFEIVQQILGQRYQLMMDEQKYNSDLENTKDDLDNMGRKLEIIKKNKD